MKRIQGICAILLCSDSLTCWSVIRGDMTPENFNIVLTSRGKGKMANLKKNDLMTDEFFTSPE